MNMPMIDQPIKWPKLGEVWEHGDSRRVVEEDYWGAEPVIYSLYRRHVAWNTKRVEWWYLRRGYCSLTTWARWIHRAKQI